MEMDTYNRLWPLMRRSGRVHLQGWGEPLLHPVFFEMAALALKAGCQVSTTTCGLRMDRELACRIVESGIDIVAFSLAGTDTASNASRHGIDFDRVCEAVTTLQAVRRERMGVHLEIHFAYLMLASNMQAVTGLPALMQRLGVHAAVISTLDYIPGPGLRCKALAPQETDKIAKAATILAKAGAEAQRLGLGFHYELPSPAASASVAAKTSAARFSFQPMAPYLHVSTSTSRRMPLIRNAACSAMCAKPILSASGMGPTSAASASVWPAGTRSCPA